MLNKIFFHTPQKSPFFTGMPASTNIDDIYEAYNKPNLPRKKIESWVNQFQPEDRAAACLLLKNINYHTYPDLQLEVKQLHQKVNDQLKRDGFDAENYTDVDFSRPFVSKRACNCS